MFPDLPEIFILRKQDGINTDTIIYTLQSCYYRKMQQNKHAFTALL